MMQNYFEPCMDGIKFIIALGSIIGMLGLIVGILGWLFLGKFQRHKMISVIIVSLILLTVCGLTTGLDYFNIQI